MQKCLVRNESSLVTTTPKKTINPYSDIRCIKPLIDQLSSYEVLSCSEHEFEVFLRELPQNRNRRILDAGCGPGIHLAAFIKKKVRVIGIDSSPFMVKEARKTGCRVELMNVKRIRFGNNTFHGVWCNTVLHHLDQYELINAFNEFRRVLVQGGLLFASIKLSSQKQIDEFGLISYPMTKDRLDSILMNEIKMDLLRTYQNREWLEVFALKPRRLSQIDPQ